MGICIEPLRARVFLPFGEVIEAGSAVKQFDINYGFSRRFHDLANINTSADGGKVGVSIFRSTPMDLPIHIKLMERHPLSSQAFIPLGAQPYLIAVAPQGTLNENKIKIFLAQPNQGVNYRAGTWHHYNLALKEKSDFLVIDRIGGGNNCDEQELATPIVIAAKDVFGGL